MNELILDIETNWTVVPPNKRPNPSPYLNTNKLVSVGVLLKKSDGSIETDYLIFNHTTLSNSCQAQSTEKLNYYLKNANLIIGHNLKFDMSWLYECGFKYDGDLYDTMIAEYVFAKGLKLPLSLDECCKRYGLDSKSDILGDYRERGINTDAVPLDLLIEYGKNDIHITNQLYEKQKALIASNEDCAYMQKAINLMNKTLAVLVDMERNGICIDLTELDRVEKDYRSEYNNLKLDLEKIVVDVMGHTPINLDSPEHLSWVLYSRKVLDKHLWAETFNLGAEVRNSVSKAKHARFMSKSAFTDIVLNQTIKLRKSEAHQCSTCIGTGKVLKIKKDGNTFKKATFCKDCDGAGYIYTPLKAFAGFKLIPISAEYASSGGFSTDKITIQELLKQENITEQCKEFLTKLLRINSISTYLGTFVEGIKKNVIGDILHCSFNPCITATGRLSSSNPNFQNLPRAKTFPIRKTIVSRFKDGKILSVDFAQLEFRVAAILGKDLQAEQDILNGTDIHQFTADTITKYGQPIDRQVAKSHTFKPLFAGSSGTEAEQKYYKEFNEKYKGISNWQLSLLQEALSTKQIKSPSGRIYAFPFTKRLANGRVTGQTQIYNYIIQGFSTGDLSGVAMIELYKRIKNLKSKFVLVVHDDCTFDVAPDEVDIMIDILKDVFSKMNSYLEQYFNISTSIPIIGDFSMGKNWMDKEKISA